MFSMVLKFFMLEMDIGSGNEDIEERGNTFFRLMPLYNLYLFLKLVCV